MWLTCSWLVLAAFAQAAAPPTYGQKIRTFHSAEEFARMTGGKVRIERRLDPAARGAAPDRRAAAQHPGHGHHVQSPAVTWVGTGRAPSASAATPAVEYFAGQRWLPDDHVTGIGFEANATWIETPKGFARIEYRR